MNTSTTEIEITAETVKVSDDSGTIRRLMALGISWASAAIIPFNSFADSLNLTTWYPAPYGVYSQLRSTGNSYFAYQGGNVGIGTTNPGLSGLNKALTISGGVSGNVASGLEIQGSQTTTNNFGNIEFFHQGNRVISVQGIRDGADNSGRLDIYTANAGSLGIGLSINKSGNVGIGTRNPAARFHLEGSGKVGIIRKNGTFPGGLFEEFQDVNGNPIGYIGYGNNVNDDLYLTNYAGQLHLVAATGYYVTQKTYPAGSVGACLTTLPGNGDDTLARCASSIRYKEDIRPLLVDRSKVLELRPVSFKWKDREERGVGLIAEEVDKLVPALVNYKDGRAEGVEYKLLGVYLLDIVKRQDAEIKELRVDIASLKKLITKHSATAD